MNLLLHKVAVMSLQSRGGDVAEYAHCFENQCVF